MTYFDPYQAIRVAAWQHISFLYFLMALFNKTCIFVEYDYLEKFPLSAIVANRNIINMESYVDVRFMFGHTRPDTS